MLKNYFKIALRNLTRNKGFTYRTDIGAGPFILAGSVLLLIALTTISYNSIRAGLRNPVESLRSE